MMLKPAANRIALSLSSHAFGIAVTLLILASPTQAQPPGPGGPGGPGGPNAPDVKILDEFDSDGDGFLNREERTKAREALKSRAKEASEQPGRRRRGGPGGRGPRGRGGARPQGTEGPKVDPADVQSYPQAGLYDNDVLRTIFINFEENDWEEELADFKPTDVEVPATLTVDEKEYPGVGVSFRGASSYFSVPAGLKRSLNLSMDLVDEDQKLYGHKTLNLLNCNGDASLMSSYLYSQIAREKTAAPLVNFVNVVINGRSWGVYANVQQFNKDFIDENFGSRKGARWKVSGSPRGDGGLRYLGDDPEEYRSRFEIKSKEKPESWASLIELCRVLNETPLDDLEAALEPLLDIDGTLWFLAADVALINSDGYWTRASDYSIYLDPDGKFHIIPHDMNEAFRASRGRGGPGGGPGGRRPRGFGGGPPPEGPPGGRRGDRGEGEGPPNRGGPPEGGRTGERDGNPGPPRGNPQGGYALDPLIGLDQERFPLRSRLLSVPALKQRYLKYVKMIAKDHIAWENLGPRVKEARQLIEQSVESDTRKLASTEAFLNATGESPTPNPGSLQEFAEQRSAFLLEYPAIKALTEGRDQE